MARTSLSAISDDTIRLKITEAESVFSSFKRLSTRYSFSKVRRLWDIPPHADMINAKTNKKYIILFFSFLIISLFVIFLQINLFILQLAYVLRFRQYGIHYFLFITLSASKYTRVPRLCGQRSAGFMSNVFARAIASSTRVINIWTS